MSEPSRREVQRRRLMMLTDKQLDAVGKLLHEQHRRAVKASFGLPVLVEYVDSGCNVRLYDGCDTLADAMGWGCPE